MYSTYSTKLQGGRSLRAYFKCLRTYISLFDLALTKEGVTPSNSTCRSSFCPVSLPLYVIVFSILKLEIR